MKEIIKQILTGVDGLPSAKRTLMLWMGIVVWSFILAAEVFVIKPFDKEVFGTTVMYSFVSMLAFGGYNVWERIGTSKEDKADTKQDSSQQ